MESNFGEMSAKSIYKSNPYCSRKIEENGSSTIDEDASTSSTATGQSTLYKRVNAKKSLKNLPVHVHSAVQTRRKSSIVNPYFTCSESDEDDGNEGM